MLQRPSPSGPRSWQEALWEALHNCRQRRKQFALTVSLLKTSRPEREEQPSLGSSNRLKRYWKTRQGCCKGRWIRAIAKGTILQSTISSGGEVEPWMREACASDPATTHLPSFDRRQSFIRWLLVQSRRGQSLQTSLGPMPLPSTSIKSRLDLFLSEICLSPFKHLTYTQEKCIYGLACRLQHLILLHCFYQDMQDYMSSLQAHANIQQCNYKLECVMQTDEPPAELAEGKYLF